jgi:hypothetical protein
VENQEKIGKNEKKLYESYYPIRQKKYNEKEVL